MAMAFAIAMIFLPAVPPFSTPALRCTESEPAFLAC
jgi:hypothetical protein